MTHYNRELFVDRVQAVLQKNFGYKIPLLSGSEVDSICIERSNLDTRYFISELKSITSFEADSNIVGNLDILEYGGLIRICLDFSDLDVFGKNGLVYNPFETQVHIEEGKIVLRKDEKLPNKKYWIFNQVSEIDPRELFPDRLFVQSYH